MIRRNNLPNSSNNKIIIYIGVFSIEKTGVKGPRGQGVKGKQQKKRDLGETAESRVKVSGDNMRPYF